MYGIDSWKRPFFHMVIKYVYYVPENISNVYLSVVAHEYIPKEHVCVVNTEHIRSAQLPNKRCILKWEKEKNGEYACVKSKNEL
jgi:hypothetical protein